MPPGASGKVPLRLTVGHSGRMSKSVFVYTNAPDPQQAALTLTIEGNVWEALECEPRTVDFASMTAEAALLEPPTRKLTITNNMEHPAELTDIRSTNPLFDVRAQTLEPGKKFELTITIAAALSPGSNSGGIELSTGIPEAPQLSIPISAYIVPDVEVTPQLIKVPATRKGSTIREILIHNNTKNAITVSDLAVSNPALNISLKETQPGMLYTIDLEIPDSVQLSPGGDKITFSTDCPTAAKLEVSVSEVQRTSRPAHPTGNKSTAPTSRAAHKQAPAQTKQ